MAKLQHHERKTFVLQQWFECSVRWLAVGMLFSIGSFLLFFYISIMILYIALYKFKYFFKVKIEVLDLVETLTCGYTYSFIDSTCFMLAIKFDFLII